MHKKTRFGLIGAGLLVAAQSFAQTPKKEPPCFGYKPLPLTVRNKKVMFCEAGSGSAYTAWCFSGQGCKAFEGAARAAAIPPRQPVGGQNPAALLCHDLKETTMFGEDPRGNQFCLCRFGDRSMATCESLFLDQKK